MVNDDSIVYGGNDFYWSVRDKLTAHQRLQEAASFLLNSGANHEMVIFLKPSFPVLGQNIEDTVRNSATRDVGYLVGRYPNPDIAIPTQFALR